MQILTSSTWTCPVPDKSYQSRFCPLFFCSFLWLFVPPYLPTFRVIVKLWPMWDNFSWSSRWHLFLLVIYFLYSHRLIEFFMRVPHLPIHTFPRDQICVDSTDCFLESRSRFDICRAFRLCLDIVVSNILFRASVFCFNFIICITWTWRNIYSVSERPWQKWKVCVCFLCVWETRVVRCLQFLSFRFCHHNFHFCSLFLYQ